MDGLGVLASCHQQVSLAAKKSGNLHHVYGFSHGGHVGGLMHVSQHRDSSFFFYPFKDAQTLFQPRTAKALQRGTVGFIVRCLEDVRHFQLARHRADSLGHLKSVGFTFNYARAGDEEELSAKIKTVEREFGWRGHLQIRISNFKF